MRRLHLWLGWIVAVPFLLWTATGLLMVSRPIDEVRGADLRREPAPLPATLAPVPPRLDGPPIVHVELTMRAGQPVWIVQQADGRMRAADARTGAPLPSVGAAEAARIARTVLADPVDVSAVRRFAADANPIDLRRGRPAWQVRTTEGLHIYIDADTGEVLAVRTRFWRAYDVAWGLHIMDLKGREDTHHVILVLSALLSLLATLAGTWLLFRRRRSATGARRAIGSTAPGG